MQTVPIVQIDAFADEPFEGNPAAVMRLEHWLDDTVLQQVAEENNLSETAFLCPIIPEAAGAPPAVWFTTLSGWVSVTKADHGRLTLDFPADAVTPVPVDADLSRILDADVIEMFRSGDLICVLRSPDEVEQLQPDLSAIAGLPQRGVAVTAATVPGGSYEQYDFVSRWFGARRSCRSATFTPRRDHPLSRCRRPGACGVAEP
jgi:predicted PhzF superfamily epimerase YddE/YHI9